MKKTIVGIILLVCALVMLVTIPALAAEGETIYVSDSGSDLATGLSDDAPLKTITAAINKLPETGGTVVLCGDVTIANAVPEFPAKGGKVTVTGEGYDATIKLSATGNMFLQFQSEIEFEHLTFNRTSTSKYAEFTTGPSLTIGEGVTFLENGKAMTKGSNCMMVRLGYSEYVTALDKKCDSASFTMLSGTVNYIQGGNKWNHVGSSTIYLGGTATVTDNVQASGTNFDVDTSSITLDGVTIPELYLNGYGAESAKSSDIKDVTVIAKNATIGKLGHQRSDGTYGNTTGTVSVTLNNTAVQTIDFSVGTIADTATFGLTLSNYDSLTMADDFAEWDSLALVNSYVYVSSAYAGPASVSVDTSGTLVLSKETNTAENVPENGQLERDYTLTLNSDGTHTLTYTDSEGTHEIVRTAGELGVVYLDGTASVCGGGATIGNPVNSFAAAYARLKDTGGTIVVIGDVTLKETYPAFPAKSGKVTVTALHSGMDYKTSLLFAGTSMELLGKSITDDAGKEYAALGLADFTTVQTKKRFVEDVYGATDLYTEPVVGFINKSSTISGVETPLLTSVQLGYGNEGLKTPEGFRYKNVIGSHLTGPILVKNPRLLDKVVSAIYEKRGEALPEKRPTNQWTEDGYAITAEQLKQRI